MIAQSICPLQRITWQSSGDRDILHPLFHFHSSLQDTRRHKEQFAIQLITPLSHFDCPSTFYFETSCNLCQFLDQFDEPYSITFCIKNHLDGRSDRILGQFGLFFLNITPHPDHLHPAAPFSRQVTGHQPSKLRSWCEASICFT